MDVNPRYICSGGEFIVKRKKDDSTDSVNKTVAKHDDDLYLYEMND